MKGQTIMQTDTLRSLIITAHEALDPHHQGVCWPDPIAWDGRPLREIARDLCSLLDAQGAADLRRLSAALWQRSGRPRRRNRACRS